MNCGRTLLRSWVAGALVSLAACLAGCDRTPAKPTPAPIQLDEGAHVTLVNQTGPFSLVKTIEGRQLYVPSDRLVNTHESGDGQEYAVITKTDVFEGTPPDKVPDLPPPRMSEEVTDARNHLPMLFITPSGVEVEKPRNTRNPSYDPKTGELLWIAYTCLNPNCPAKGTGKKGRPFVFILPVPGWTLGPDGPKFDPSAPFSPDAPHRRPDITNLTSHQMECPACLKIRSKGVESPQMEQQYRDWVQMYMLPEARARTERLNSEHQARLKADRALEPPGTYEPPGPAQEPPAPASAPGQ